MRERQKYIKRDKERGRDTERWRGSKKNLSMETDNPKSVDIVEAGL